MAMADDGECCGLEQVEQITVNLFTDAAKPVLAPMRPASERAQIATAWLPVLRDRHELLV